MGARFLDSIYQPAAVLSVGGKIIAYNEAFRLFWGFTDLVRSKKFTEIGLIKHKGYDLIKWVDKSVWKMAFHLEDDETIIKHVNFVAKGKKVNISLHFSKTPLDSESFLSNKNTCLVTYQLPNDSFLSSNPGFIEKLFQHLNTGILLFDSKYQLVEGNHYALKTFNILPNEITAYKITDFFEVEQQQIVLHAIQVIPSCGFSKPFLTHLLPHQRNQQSSIRLSFAQVQTQPYPLYVASFSDATSDYETQEQLRKFSNAIENGPSVVVITDTKGNIEYVNKEFTSLTGCTAEEVVGKNPRVLKSNSQDKSFYKDMWSTIKAGKVWQGDFHNKKKNGENYWERASIAPIKDEHGEITHFVAVKENITESKLATQEIARKEFIYRKLVQNLPGIGVSLFDEKFRYILAEGNAINDLGIDKKQVENKFVHEVLPPELLQQSVLSFQKALDGKTTVKVQEVNNKVYDVKVVPIRDEQLNVMMGMSVISDITELMRAEESIIENVEFLQTIIQTIPNAFFYKDLEGRYLDCNETFAKIYNLSKREIIGKTDFELTPKDMAQLFHLSDKHLIQKGSKEVYELNVDMTKPMKEGFYIVHKALYYKKDHTPAGIVGIVHNLTYRKIYEEEIEKQNEKLKELDREKDSLISIVAHDLKSPLSKVQGLANLILMSGPINSEQQEYLNLMQQVSQNGNDLIRDILEISMYEHNHVAPSIQLFSIKPFIENALETFIRQAQEKSIGLQISAPANNFHIHSDANYLSRIIDNLVSNAIKFSIFHSQIYFSYSFQNEWMVISVRDEGPGISKKDQEKMFKKFQKLSAKPTANEHSTGLGLSIIKVLVEQLQGKIEVISELGKGSEFIVSIPDAKP